MKHLVIVAVTGLLTACGNNSSNSAGQSAAAGDTAASNSSQPAAKTSSPEPSAAPTLTCTLNGRDWKGGNIYNGNLYYAKGITGMNGGKPHMMLSFRSVAAPDNRQLTISFKNFQGKTGLYAKEALEILLSGSVTGDAQKSELQGHKVPGQSTNFSVEITDWKTAKSDEAIISGKLSGTLKGVLGSPDVTIENGAFTNVAVKVFSDKY